LINARLFRALAHATLHADAAKIGEKHKNELLERMRQIIHSNLITATNPLEGLLADKMGSLTSEQKEVVKSTYTILKRLLAMVS
jgi:hypothetical protein